MQTTRIGRTGLRVSRICLGTMNFGPFTKEKDAFAIMDRALEAGVQFFDTANGYGGSAGRGATETILGNYLAQDNDPIARGRAEERMFGTLANPAFL